MFERRASHSAAGKAQIAQQLTVQLECQASLRIGRQSALSPVHPIARSPYRSLTHSIASSLYRRFTLSIERLNGLKINGATERVENGQFDEATDS